MENKLLTTIIIVAGILVAAFVLASALKNMPGATTAGEQQRNTISVAGESTIDVEPDKAEVYVMVQTRAKEAKEAQDENNRISNDVIDALVEAGVAKTDIETDWFNLGPEYDWSDGTQTLIGYLAQHSLKVTTTDLTKVGDLVDTAVNAGANNIQSINFGLTKDKEKEVYNEALIRASELAQLKAQSIASAIGSRLGDLVSISESSSNYYPYIYRMDTAVAEGGGMEAPKAAPIQPEKITVSGHVSMIYEIK
jgi:hypothetical protein